MPHREALDGAGAFSPSLLGEAVRRIGADGRLSARDVPALRRTLDGAGAGECSAVLAEPETVLGPFESLSREAQRAILETLAQDDRWRMAGYKIGAWHAAMTRLIWGAQSKLPHGRLRDQLVRLFGTAVQVGPAWGIHLLSRRLRAWRGRFGPRPRLAEMLAAARVEPRNLAVCYARGVPQLPGYRGYWHDASCHTTVGLIIGIDFIQDSEGYWHLESNMDCGLRPERTALYAEDPFVRNLLDFVAGNGYRRLVVVSGTSSVDPAMARQYKDGAAARNVAVALFEEAFHPTYGHRLSLDLPPLETHTLVVRNRYYRTSLDYVVQHKRASYRALRLYKQGSGDSTFQLPATSSEPRVGPGDPGDPFPNLVFKFPERDKGEGVVFLKVASASHAKEILAEAVRAARSESVVSRLYSRLDDQQGLYQPYVRTSWLPDRRLYKTRANVLLTPVGTHFLSANRIVSTRPVPKELPLGVVRDPQPYLLSYPAGAKFDVVPPEEEAAVRQAALGVARGLSWAISYGFQTGPWDGQSREDTQKARGRS